MHKTMLPLMAAALVFGAYAAHAEDAKVRAAVAARTTTGLTPVEINHVYWVPTEAIPAAEVEANKEVVLDWWRQYWDRADTEHWRNWLSPSFVNHDPREPLHGGQALTDFLVRSRPNGGKGSGFGPGGGQTAPQSFALADGNLVLIVHSPMGWDIKNPPAGADPLTSLAGNIVRVDGGRVQEWWYLGATQAGGPPRGAPPPGGAAGGPPPGGPPPGAPAVKQPGSDGVDLAAGSTRIVDHQGTPIIYDSGKSSAATQAANKKLVQAWLDDFWLNQNYDAWPKYLTADFRDHDPSQPAVGAKALVDYLRASPTEGAKKGQAAAHLFILAEGDLVFVGGAAESATSFDPDVQPKAVTGNIIQVKNGKIVAWWAIGGGIDASVRQ